MEKGTRQEWRQGIAPVTKQSGEIPNVYTYVTKDVKKFATLSSFSFFSGKGQS